MLTKNVTRIMHDVMASDRTQLQVRAGLRSALGIALPLCAGLAMHQVALSVIVAVGALVSGMAGITGTTRQRLRTMLSAGACMGAAAFIGGVAAHGLVLSAAVVFLSAFLAGLMIAVSSQAAQLGLLTTVVLVIFTAFPSSVSASADRMLLVALGSLLQAALMLGFSTLGRGNAEVQGAQSAYAAMAEFARRRSRTAGGQAGQALSLAEARLRDSFHRWPSWEQSYLLLDSVERIRGELSALVLLSRSPRGGVATGTTEERALWEKIFSALASALDARGSAILSTMDMGAGQEWRNLRAQLEQRAKDCPGLWQSGRQHSSKIMDDLGYIGEQLAQPPRSGVVAPMPGERPSVESLVRNMGQTAWANLTFRSAAFQHALRLAVTLAVAAALYRVMALPRGYWVPLTALVILKPDFFTTVVRGAARVGGTVTGVVLASALIAVPDPAGWFRIVLVVVFGAAIYTILNVNYAVFSVFMTAEVVVLLSFFEQVPAAVALQDRLLDTLIGSALAVTAFAVWPAGGKKSPSRAVADLIDAEVRYWEFMVGNAPARSLSAASTLFYRQQIRLARTTATASIERARAGSASSAVDWKQAAQLLMAVRRLHEGLVALEAAMIQESLGGALGEQDWQRYGQWFQGLASNLAMTAAAVANSDGTPPMDESFQDAVALQCYEAPTVPGPSATIMNKVAVRLGRNVATILRMLP